MKSSSEQDIKLNRAPKTNSLQTVLKLLDLLSDGETFVSREKITRTLGISLRTLTSYLSVLETEGILLERKSGFGIKMINSPRVKFQYRLAEDEKHAVQMVYEHAKDDPTLMTKTFETGCHKLKKIMENASEKELSIIEIPYLNHVGERPMIEQETKWKELVLHAVGETNIIRMHYNSINNNAYNENERLVIPLGILYIQSNLYMDAWCLIDKSQKRYKLARVTQLNIQTATSSQKKMMKTLLESYSAQDDLKNNIGAFSAQKQAITLHVYPPLSTVIQERLWVSDQTVEQLDDESVIVKGTFSIGPELTSWVLGMGSYVKVLEGDWLKSSVLEHIMQMQFYYK